jgi:TonB-dependent SusC/RagA subfamily outer membrane receptor
MKKIYKFFFMILVLAEMVSPSQLLAQEATVSGKVTGEGEELPGVNILVQGTTIGTVTDIDGNYSISAVGENPVLVFSSVGYQTQEVAVNGRSVVNVDMEVDLTQLGEVVVTALGIEKDRKALGYSVGEIDGQELSQSKEVNFVNNLQGKVAGVNITRAASGPGGSARVIIRGNSSISGTNQPLYVIDGVPMDNSNLGAAGAWGGRDYGDGISNLNPDDIESISVLKGANGAALYGERGANGVILVTTKTGKGKGKMEVSLNASLNFGKASVLPEFQNSYGQGLNGQFTHLRTADGSIVVNDGTATGTPQGFPAPTGGAPEGPPSWGPKMEGQDYIDVFGVRRPFSPEPNNYEDFFDTEKIATTTLNVAGSTDQFNYLFSGSFLNNKGLLPTNELDRYTANLRKNN